MLKDLIRLFISRSCCACEKALTSEESYLCGGCISQLPQTHFTESPTENELYYRLGGKVPLHGATGLFYFDKKGLLQQVIKTLKYDNLPQLGEELGRMLGTHLRDSEFIKEVEVLVPVPLHPRKQIKRGYNQAESIAIGMGKELALPVNTTHLKRSKFTTSQTRHSIEERYQNMQGAFTAKELSEKGILLVDDVVTTGATVEACIHALVGVQPASTTYKVAAVGVARKS
ncbi:MAG: phosphoribosyltransferase family protein [Bacteroidota bacterium]